MKQSAFRRISKILGKIGFELIPVIVGILIALVINDYQESLNEKERIDVLLNNLVGEYTNRRNEIDSLVTYRHQPFVDTLENYLHNSQIPIAEILSKVGGFAFSEVYTVSWEAALSNQDIGKLDFELLTLLSKISASQESLGVVTQNLLN